jgi:hypothetical protein
MRKTYAGAVGRSAQGGVVVAIKKRMAGGSMLVRRRSRAGHMLLPAYRAYLLETYDETMNGRKLLPFSPVVNVRCAKSCRPHGGMWKKWEEFARRTQGEGIVSVNGIEL